LSEVAGGHADRLLKKAESGSSINKKGISRDRCSSFYSRSTSSAINGSGAASIVAPELFEKRWFANGTQKLYDLYVKLTQNSLREVPKF
jgi:hypothetical protein